MSLTKRRRHLGACLLLVAFWCGACNGKRVPTETPTTAQDNQQDQDAAASPPGLQHSFDKTEVDLEYGRLVSTSRYHHPRGIQLYTFDETETDLSTGLKRIDQSPPR